MRVLPLSSMNRAHEVACPSLTSYPRPPLPRPLEAQPLAEDLPDGSQVPLEDDVSFTNPLLDARLRRLQPENRRLSSQQVKNRYSNIPLF
jgi:hypothetical protein